MHWIKANDLSSKANCLRLQQTQPANQFTPVTVVSNACLAPLFSSLSYPFARKSPCHVQMGYLRHFLALALLFPLLFSFFSPSPFLPSLSPCLLPLPQHPLPHPLSLQLSPNLPLQPLDNPLHLLRILLEPKPIAAFHP